MVTQHTIEIKLSHSTEAPFVGQINAQYITPDQSEWAENEGGGFKPCPFLLFHDSLGSVDLWKDFPQNLANRTSRDVIIYDRLGFGKSTAREDPFSSDFIHREAKEVVPQILAYFHLDHFMVLGHSVGGAMASVTAAIYRDQCQGLIAMSTQAFNDEKIVASIHENYNYFEDERKFAQLSKYHGDKTRWVLDGWARVWTSPEFTNWSLMPLIENIVCPALVLQGSEDEYNDPIHSKTISQVLANSKLLIIPNTGHFPHRQESEIVLNAIEDFLKEKQKG